MPQSKKKRWAHNNMLRRSHSEQPTSPMIPGPFRGLGFLRESVVGGLTIVGGLLMAFCNAIVGHLQITPCRPALRKLVIRFLEGGWHPISVAFPLPRASRSELRPKQEHLCCRLTTEISVFLAWCSSVEVAFTPCWCYEKTPSKWLFPRHLKRTIPSNRPKA